MRRSFRTSLAATLLTFGVFGCTSGTSPTSPDGVTQVVKSSLEREAPTPGAEVAAAEDLAQFGWAFYVQAAKPAENFVYSPYSISVASAMLSAGADGQTLSEIQQALRFRSAGAPLHEAQNALSQVLQSRNREASEEYNAQTLRVSNDFWMLPDLRPTDAFLDPLAQHYGAEVHLTPFDTRPEESRQAINQKVSGDTAALIPELLPENSIDSSVVFVLTNALYFKGRWSSQFTESATQPAPFYSVDGTEGEVPMMHQVEYYPYTAGSGFEAIALPYDRAELEMVVVVPDDFSTFQAALSEETIADIRDGLESTRLELGFPKFEVATSVPLKEELQAAGVVRAFQDGVAEFPNIASAVFISDAFHQARIVVDEEGTEAAAATAFVGTVTSAPIDEPLPVTVDRPFIYWIRDTATDAVLFLGHYVQAD